MSVSNPKSKHVAYASVLSQISNCQSLGRKNKNKILKTDRSGEIWAYAREELRFLLTASSQVCIYVNKYIYIHMCILYLSLSLSLSISLSLYIYIERDMCVCMYVCMYVCVYIYIYIYTCMYVCMCIYTYIYIYIYISTAPVRHQVGYMCVYVYMCYFITYHTHNIYIYICI